MRQVFILAVLGGVLLVSRCNKNPDFHHIDVKQKLPAERGFIYTSGKEFRIKHERFFPLMLNYSISIRNVSGNYFPSSIKEYENPTVYEGNCKDSSLNVIKGHFKLIKELGFNTIRLIGIDKLSRNIKGDYGYSVNKENSDEFLTIKDGSSQIIQALNDVIAIAKELDLHLMILLKPPINSTDIESFTIKVLSTFKNEPSVFSYDFFNEPLYFDINDNAKDPYVFREKKDAYNIVSDWKEMMMNFAPNQLFTIGFAEPIEVFEWDPTILPVDFVNMHTYHPLRVPNEIYWYSKNIDKPWMIGETSLPADNDSISYKDQKQFLTEAYLRTINCDGSGFGWWAFQDVTSWGTFEHNYTSILNHEGVTYTTDGKHRILGSVKPAGLEIKNLSRLKSSKVCECWTNYHNMLGYENYVVEGKILIARSLRKVSGAVIRGWNEDWSVGANTFSDEEGNFTLYSNTEFVHFEISAPGLNKVRLDLKTPYASVEKVATPKSKLANQKLEYQKISYRPFLKYPNFSEAPDSLNRIFNFKSEMFNSYKYKKVMPDVLLEKVDLYSTN
jgi:hypothetical protein